MLLRIVQIRLRLLSRVCCIHSYLTIDRARKKFKCLLGLIKKRLTIPFPRFSLLYVFLLHFPNYLVRLFFLLFISFLAFLCFVFSYVFSSFFVSSILLFSLIFLFLFIFSSFSLEADRSWNVNHLIGLSERKFFWKKK